MENCGDNQGMTVALSAAERSSLELLTSDLKRVFGGRLQSIVAYGAAALTAADDQPLHTLVLVEQVGFPDVAACTAFTDSWRAHGLATPLVLSRHEFKRTLDVFPVEYGAIIDRHVVIFGADPFAGCAVCEADLRRAVELQAKSHLIHLREGFLETGGHSDRISRLITASAPAYRALLDNLERLEPGVAGEAHGTSAAAPGAANQLAVSRAILQEIAAGGTVADPRALLERYVADVERIWTYVDAWRP